jgi:hypothetical protein
MYPVGLSAGIYIKTQLTPGKATPQSPHFGAVGDFFKCKTCSGLVGFSVVRQSSSVCCSLNHFGEKRFFMKI